MYVIKSYHFALRMQKSESQWESGQVVSFVLNELRYVDFTTNLIIAKKWDS